MANLRLKRIVPECLDMCNTLTIQRFFFEKCGATWMLTCAFLYSSLQLALMYMQYSKGLDAVQTAFAMKKYKSHRRVGLPSDIIASM